MKSSGNYLVPAEFPGIVLALLYLLIKDKQQQMATEDDR
jgi:hypothetical protein